MVEKTLQIVLAILGFKNLSWNTAKDLLSRASFKTELSAANYLNIKGENVLRGQLILIQKTNSLLTPENVQINSEAAALLLIWAANIIKQYAAAKYLKDKLKKPP
jgi:hypothetical protein